jgi:hypothetical protein
MINLRVPSLQHLARNWHSDARLVKRALVRLALNKPIFNYDPLLYAVRDMLVFNQPYDEIVKGIERHTPRKFVRRCLLDVLPLIREHFDGIDASFVQDVQPRHYAVAKNLLVPFKPPLVYGAGGRIYFPWFSFWRSNPIVDRRLSLFVTIVEEILLSDPDLENAKFEILDFSAGEPKGMRVLTLIDTVDVPRVSDETKKEMLSIFADGFFQAQAELAAIVASKQEHSPPDDYTMQRDLFDT